MKDVYELIQEEHLTEDLKLIAAITGMDTLRNMLRHLKGLHIYIPKLTRLDSFVVEFINNNSDKPIKAIAYELGVSEQYLRNMQKNIRINKYKDRAF